MSVGTHQESPEPERLVEEVKPPIVTQAHVDPSLLTSVADIENPPERSSSVKRLVRLKSLLPSEKAQIIAELKAGVDNPYFKLSGKNNLRYKDRSYANKGSKAYRVFEEKGHRKLSEA
jgi:hypothetical protein